MATQSEKPSKTKKTQTATPKTGKAKKASAVDGIVKVKIGENSIQWKLNPKVYPLEVVYQASFVFIDRAYLFLDMDDDKQILVQLKGKETLDEAALKALQGEFANELLNHAVRKNVAKQNKRIRELIVAKALFAAGRPQELREISEGMSGLTSSAAEPPRPWDDATEEEQEELDRLLAEIEKDFAEDPMGIAVPWDEKYGEDGDNAPAEPDKDDKKS